MYKYKLSEKEITGLHRQAMKVFGVETWIDHDDIVRFIVPTWNGIQNTLNSPGTYRWLDFRYYIRHQPAGVDGYQFVCKPKTAATPTMYKYTR
jgi:hypothetical protein